MKLSLARWMFSGGRFAAWSRVLAWAAKRWRPFLKNTIFIGITGSVGKTTAKECLGAILSTGHPTVRTFDTQNALHGVARTVLRARPWHRYAVLEFGAARSHLIDLTAPLARHSVAVVLCVDAAHLTHYGTLEKIAEAKGKLVEALPPEGLAVLNADDPRVAAMAARCPGRVVTFGQNADADFRATAVSADWPHRLSFRITHGERTCRVATRLVGAQYMPSVLAAMATAVSLGTDIEDAAQAVASVEPHPGRTQPLELPNGAIVLRDEFGGNWLHVRAGLRVLRRARGRRRIAVLGVISEGGKRYQKTARRLGREAAGCVDALVFVGPGWRYGMKGGTEGGLAADRVHGFATAREAAEWLRGELREGDLAYLTGRVRLHLTRIAYAQLGEVRCWREECHLPILCDFCPELGFRPGR